MRNMWWRPWSIKYRSHMRTVISNGKYLLKSVIDHGNRYISTKTPCLHMWASISCGTKHVEENYPKKKTVKVSIRTTLWVDEKMWAYIFWAAFSASLRKTARTSLNCGHCSFCTIATGTTRPRPWYWPIPRRLGRCLSTKEPWSKKRIMVGLKRIME